ncbi:MAG: polyhydroxyalkanoate depolymerase, partial [Devosia sp.]|nr:polyhydroxyalkanoate depolymerase [Devosia sp.]
MGGDRKGAAEAFDHGCIVEEAGDGGAINGGGHDEDAQIGAERGCIEGEGEAKIAIEAALVKFVKEDGGDAGQFGIIHQHAGEDAFGDHFDARPGANAAIHADPVAHGRADLFAQQARHLGGGGAGGKPARLDHDDAAIRAPGRIQKGEGHAGGLAGAGGRHQHGIGAGGQRVVKGWESFVDGKGRQGHGPGCGAWRGRGQALRNDEERVGTGGWRASEEGGSVRLPGLWGQRMTIAGWIMTGLLALFMLGASVAPKLLGSTLALEPLQAVGWPPKYMLLIGVIEAVCTVLFVIPRTSLLGAVLLTGLLGAALAANLRVDN